MAAENCRFEHRRAQSIRKHTHLHTHRHAYEGTSCIHECIHRAQFNVFSWWIHIVCQRQNTTPTTRPFTWIHSPFFRSIFISVFCFPSLLPSLFIAGISIGFGMPSYLLAIRFYLAFTRVTVIYNRTHWGIVHFSIAKKEIENRLTYSFTFLCIHCLWCK